MGLRYPYGLATELCALQRVAMGSGLDTERDIASVPIYSHELQPTSTQMARRG